MEILLIVLSVIFVPTLIFGIYFFLWYRRNVGEMDMSLARLERIKALICREDFRYVYSVMERNGANYVLMFDFEIGSIPVKRFYDEDKSYARRCAEELCDKLNERI